MKIIAVFCIVVIWKWYVNLVKVVVLESILVLEKIVLLGVIVDLETVAVL